MSLQEIAKTLIPIQFKYTSLGFNFGFCLALCVSLLLSTKFIKFFAVIYIILFLFQVYQMKDELRELFN